MKTYFFTFLAAGNVLATAPSNAAYKKTDSRKEKKTIFMRDLSERDGWKSATIPSAFDCLANFLFYFARISMTDDIEQKIDRK